MFSLAASEVTLAVIIASSVGSTAEIVMLIASAPGGMTGIGGSSTVAASQLMFSGFSKLVTAPSPVLVDIVFGQVVFQGRG